MLIPGLQRSTQWPQKLHAAMLAMCCIQCYGSLPVYIMTKWRTGNTVGCPRLCAGTSTQLPTCSTTFSC